jgi:signal transduction histidine kinase/CheY-like chemotaxis protein
VKERTASKVRRLDALGLRYHLGLLVLATAVPLVALSLLLFDSMVGNERQGLRSALMNSARTLAALVDNEIDTPAAIAATLAQSRALAAGDYAGFREEARAALAFVPGAWLELCDPSGQLILTTLTEPGTPLAGRIEADLQKLFARNRPQVSDIVDDPVAHRKVALLEYPVLKDGRPAYLFVVSLLPERFLDLVRNKFDQGELIGILDRQSRFVARIPDHAARVGTLASEGWLAAIAQAPEGWADNRTLEGDLAITAYASTARGWVVGISYKAAILDAPLRRIVWSVALTAAALILASLGLAYLQARRFTRGMGGLAALAREVGSGRRVEPPAAVFREAGMIGRALSDASILLEARARELARLNTELEDKVAARSSELIAEMHRREDSENRLRQAQKMEAIGQLTGGIAHDFNNMLGVIAGSLDLMNRRIRKGDFGIERFLEAATRATERAATLTHRLLAFARQQPLAPEAIDANKMIAQMSGLLRATLGEHIQIEAVSAGGLWITAADAHQLESAILNIAINARDAMPEGGKLTIETGNAYLDEAYCAQHPEAAAGQYVMIAISDTGCGMPPAIAARAFDPFFTTKPAGKGTGLGLSQVYGFIKQSHGHSRIYSEPGAGTTVKIYLPRLLAGEDTPLVRGMAEAVETSRAGETILVVEDDGLMRLMSADALRDLGYTVVDCESGARALAILDGMAGIDLLFTDVVMPDMNGPKLADEALRRRPDLKVLYTTGHTPNAVVHGGVLDAGVNLLSKPFTLAQLARKVRAVLDQ